VFSVCCQKFSKMRKKEERGMVVSKPGIGNAANASKKRL
jgi:hypothetical protein